MNSKMSPEEQAIFLFRIIGNIMGWKENWVNASAADFSIGNRISLRITAVDQDPERLLGVIFTGRLYNRDGSLHSLQLPKYLIDALSLIRMQIDNRSPS